MNIFKQIRAFYSKVFEGDLDLNPNHISLYMFLLNQNNRTNWSKWFKVPFDTAMMGACINSNKTYYKVLNELKEYGFIDYVKGKNNYKAPKIRIINLIDNSEIPKPENNEDQEDIFSMVKDTNVKNALVEFTQLLTQLPTQLSTQLLTQLLTQLGTQQHTNQHTNKDIHITCNLITNNKHDEIKNLLDFEYNKSFEEILIEWFKYKKDRKESYKSQTSRKKFYTKLYNLSNGDVEKAQQIIDQSMANNWAGIFGLKDTQKQQDYDPSKLFE